MKPRFEVEIVWEDEHMIQLSVYACNESFSGNAKCYTSRQDVEDYAKLVKGFPRKIDEWVEFGTGFGEEISCFNCVFRPTYRTGHYQACISIIHAITYTNSRKDLAKVYLEFDIEPAAIDTFANSLLALSKLPPGQGKATLHGKA